jgi:hypothetical protein
VSSAVSVSVASVPDRARGLAAVVQALLPQADLVHVYLNGYDTVPGFLDHPRIRVARSQRDGDRGDAGKFFWSDRVHGYHLVCDDDLRYPADYVESLVASIDAYGRAAVVGFHGAVLHEEIVDYHRSRTLSHFQRALPEDRVVHVLGTGVAGYHTTALTVRPSDFRTPNMADIWFALLGQRQRVPFVCLQREANWVRPAPGFYAASLYARARRAGSGDVSEQTRTVRSQRPWRLHPVARE